VDKESAVWSPSLQKKFDDQVSRGILPTVPLPEYLRCAWQYNKEPEEFDGWRSTMWSFIWLAKSHPDLAGLDADPAAEIIEREAAKWIAAEGDLWQDCFPDADDPYIEFLATWPKVRVPLGKVGALEKAVAEAKELPLSPARRCTEKYRIFVSIAGHLQRSEGNRPILLPCHKLAPLIGVTAARIADYRRIAINDGILLPLRKGSFAARRADEFRFRVDAFEFVTGRQTRCFKAGDFTQERQELQDLQEKQELQVAHESHRTPDTNEAKETQDAHDSEILTDMHDSDGYRKDPHGIKGKDSEGKPLKKAVGGNIVDYTERMQLLQRQKAELLSRRTE
jgi:hypothetical protein